MLIWLGGAFVIYALASLLWAPTFAPLAIVHLGTLVGAFWLGRRLAPEANVIWFGYIIFMIAIGGIWIGWPFLNPNMIGAALALGLAAALAYGMWAAAPFLGVMLLFTQSRGAIIAGGVAVLLGIGRRYPLGAFAILCVGLLSALTQKVLGDSLFNRLGVWQDTLDHLTLFGSGWGSFADAYLSWPVHRNMTLLIAQHAYNDYLELLFELGIGMIPLILLLVFALAHDGPSRLIVWTFLILGLTYFPLYVPVVGQLAVFALGTLTTGESYARTLGFNGQPLHPHHPPA